jgi:hypothetical protein
VGTCGDRAISIEKYAMVRFERSKSAEGEDKKVLVCIVVLIIRRRDTG